MRATFPMLLLAACSNAPGNNQATSAPTPTPLASPVFVPTATPSVSPPASASDVAEKAADFSFSYSYPAAAAAIAPFAAWLERDRAAVRADIAKQAANGRRELAGGDFPFHRYESTTTWKVVTDTPRFLSLSAESYVFTGGAHGSPGFRAALWDKARGERLEPGAVFTSPAALQAAIGDAFCQRIDRLRELRRGTPVMRSADDPFSQCPKVSKTTVILGSTDSRAIDRIGLLVGPYVAGPYAEGRYDVTLAITPDLLDTVKPAYRDAFAR